MIAPLRPLQDGVVADFWVQAWQATMPEIDFGARRSWIVDHVSHMRQSGQIVRACFENDQPIGFYTLFASTGLLEQICVSLSAAGKGIGTLLIADATQHTAKTLNLVVNEDNHSARRFYEHLGFVQTGYGVNAASKRATLIMESSANSA